MGHFWSVAKVALRFGCAKQSKNLWLIGKIPPLLPILDSTVHSRECKEMKYHVIPNQYIFCLNESFQVKDITKLKNWKDPSEAVNGSLYMVSLPGTSLAVHSALWCTYFQFFSKFHGLKYCLYLLFQITLFGEISRPMRY